MQANRDQIRDQIRANAVLKDREFSWCLHQDVAFLKSSFGERSD